MKLYDQGRKGVALLTVMLMLMAGFIGSAEARKSKSPDEAARRKARHYYMSAVQQEVAGNTAAGAELFRKAYESDSTYAEAALQYGVRRYGMPQSGLSTDAEKRNSQRIARKFIDAYPGDIFPNLLYANIMESADELQEAVAVMERLNKENPGNTDVMQMLSGLYLDINEPEKAVEMLDGIARIDGEDAEYFVRKAGIKVALNDTVGALDVARQWIVTSPAEAGAPAFLARMQSYFGMQEEALSNFRKAEDMMEPNNGGSIKLQMASYYKTLGDSVNFDNKTYEALLCEDLDFSTKKDVLAYYLQGIIDGNGDRARGDKLFGVLLSQYPHEPELLALASRYSASKKDYVKALEEIDYALDLDHSVNE
ncbi:MAG: tetratricopeptide repeat protein, partial [Muribaculaceae bacterium]|nr:tetratricopeptide repeat protein [Muribaculaceae bacterium]